MDFLLSGTISLELMWRLLLTARTQPCILCWNISSVSLFLRVTMKKASSMRATKSQKSTSSTNSKRKSESKPKSTQSKPRKKKLEATTDTAWEKLASTPKTSASTPEKTQSATSDKFPWEMFPIRLDIKKEKRVCWFECEDHMNKLILREQLTPKDYTISTNGVKLVGLPKPKRRRKTK